MKPLSFQVWLYVATAFLCISITEFALSKLVFDSNSQFGLGYRIICIIYHFRITDLDWENPHPCDENPEELENIWNMHNCIWLAVGSIMQQGCDILPKSVHIFPQFSVSGFRNIFCILIAEAFRLA